MPGTILNTVAQGHGDTEAEATNHCVSVPPCLRASVLKSRASPAHTGMRKWDNRVSSLRRRTLLLAIRFPPSCTSERPAAVPLRNGPAACHCLPPGTDARALRRRRDPAHRPPHTLVPTAVEAQAPHRCARESATSTPPSSVQPWIDSALLPVRSRQTCASSNWASASA